MSQKINKVVLYTIGLTMFVLSWVYHDRAAWAGGAVLLGIAISLEGE